MATLTGTSNNDSLNASSPNGDTVSGLGGDDTLTGAGGNDSLDGGIGNDSLSGLFGNDTLIGGEGNDSLYGGKGNDQISGGNGTDTAFFSTSFLNYQISALYNASNVLTGYQILDSFGTQDGTDTVSLDVEFLQFNNSNDPNNLLTLSAGRLIGSNGLSYVFGGLQNDTLSGSTGNDIISGGDGNDRADAGIGNDSLNGDNGNDTLLGAAGDDTLNGGDGNDSLDGGEGTDFLNGGNGNDTLLGLNGDDILNGGNGNDSLDGGQGIDVLFGGNGNDTISGGDGNDSLYGGKENDQISGGNGTDTAFFTNGFRDYSISTIYNATNVLTGYQLLNLFVGQDGKDTVSTDVEFLAFNNSNDPINVFTLSAGKLIGNNGSTYVFGSLSNDTLYGGMANDNLSGGDGNDSIEAGDGSDELNGDNGNDTLRGGAGNDTLFGALGNDSLDGGAGNDTVDGGSGNDSLTGGDGNDSINGGMGNDRFYLGADAGSDTIEGGGFNTSQGWPSSLVINLPGLADADINDYDILIYSASTSGISVNLTNRTVAVPLLDGVDTYSNIEQIRGTTSSDTVVGKPSEGNGFYFTGLGGSDRVYQDPYGYTGRWADGLTVGYWWSETGLDIKWVGSTATVKYGAGTGSLGGYGAYSAGVDTLEGIGFIETSNFNDVVDATGMTINHFGYKTNSEDGVSYALLTYRVGDDTYRGNGNLIISLGNSVFVPTTGTLPAGFVVDARTLGSDGFITIDLKALKWSEKDTTALGTIKFTGASYLFGTPFNDTLWAGNGVTSFRGQAGNDTFYGDRFWNTSSYRSATNPVTINLAEGRVTDGTAALPGGTSQGTDTLRGVESIEGTRYSDVFDARKFDRFSTNGGGDEAGFYGQNNSYKPLGGNDTVTGNGYTGLSYEAAKMGIFADLQAGFVDALGQDKSSPDTRPELQNNQDFLYTVGRTTFTGVNGIEGSDYDDYLKGGASTNGEAYSGITSYQSFSPRGGNDTVDGGIGNDIVSYRSSPNAIRVDLSKPTAQVTNDGWNNQDTLINIERVDGSNYSDVMVGGTAKIWFKGNAGDDTIIGGSASDDHVTYANYRIPDYKGVIVDLGGTSTVLTPAQLSLKPITTSYSYTPSGGGASDPISITGWAIDGSGDIDLLARIENVSGSDWDDVIVGSNQNNELSGRAGADTIDGAGGVDWVTYGNAEQGVKVDLQRSIAENDGFGYSDVLYNIENIIGSGWSDSLVGSTSDNELQGEFGNDTLSGGGGNDTFVIQNSYEYVDPNELEQDQVLDFNAGDKLRFETAVTLGNSRSQLTTGQIFIESSTDGAVVYLGRDSTLGADMSILLRGVNSAGLSLGGGNREVSLSSANAPATFTLSSSTPSLFEGNTATFLVTLNGSINSDTTVYFSTDAGTATAGADFGQISGKPLVFTASGSRSQVISIPIYADAAEETTAETFTASIRSSADSPVLASSAPVLINDILSPQAPRSSVFLTSASHTALGSSTVRTYGNTGDESVIITKESLNVVMDQAVERVYLPLKSIDYKFARAGNQLSVFENSSSQPLILKTPLQSDTVASATATPGTEFVFLGDLLTPATKAAVSATLVNGTMSMGGKTVEAAPSVLTFTAAALIAPTKAVPTTSTTALAFIGSNGNFTAATDGLQVFGTAQADTLRVPDKLLYLPPTPVAPLATDPIKAAIVADQLVDNFQFDSALMNYSFMQTGNQLNVYPRLNPVIKKPLLNLTVQGDSDGTQLLFGSSSYSVKLVSGGVMKLGDNTISTVAPTPIDTMTVVKVSPIGAYDALSQDVRFEVPLGGLEFTINNFGASDVLVLPNGTNASLFNDSYSDGSVYLEWGVAGKTSRITFNGLSPSLDLKLNNVEDFNLAFGSGSLTFAGAVTGSAQTAAISAAGFRQESASTNTRFTVAAVTTSYSYEIVGFGAGDQIVSPAGAAVSLLNTSFSDTTATLQYASGANIVTIRLTGLTTAQDQALSTPANLNQVFGAGTFA
jgi:Ca2+-binding RTX toxin-like protein